MQVTYWSYSVGSNIAFDQSLIFLYPILSLGFGEFKPAASHSEDAALTVK
jgi:hypothetical protein